MKSRSKTAIELIVAAHGKPELAELQEGLLASLSPAVRRALREYLKEEGK